MKKITTMVLVAILVCSISFVCNAGTISDSAAVTVIDLNPSQTNIVIESNGWSEFVDVFATMSDNSLLNVTTNAIWKTDDQEVAIPIPEEGRILAEGKGKAKITIIYGGIERTINVKVLKQVDLVKEAKAFHETFKMNSIDASVIPYSLTDSERTAIYDKAMAMICNMWTAEKDLIGWKSQYIFEKGKRHPGIPYSQTPYQKDKTGFNSALSLSDFYTPLYFTQNGTQYIQPRYGNDCSGFTSFAWGIPRITTEIFYNRIKDGTYPKVGSYDASSPTAPSTTDLKNSYKLLQLGDAVVMRNATNTSGHVFVINVNLTSSSKVQCFEQTPPYCKITYWTYDQLASSKYMPFSKK